MVVVVQEDLDLRRVGKKRCRCKRGDARRVWSNGTGAPRVLVTQASKRARARESVERARESDSDRESTVGSVEGRVPSEEGGGGREARTKSYTNLTS